MITDALLFLINLLLQGVISILPGMPPGLGDVFDSISTLVHEGARKLGPFNVIFPVFETSIYLVIVWTVMIPAEVIYNAATWLWARIPVFGGGS